MKNINEEMKNLGDALCCYCPLENKGVYGINGGYLAGCEGSKCDEAFENYLEDKKSMNNIVEIENYMLSVNLNLLNHLDREGYYVKNIYLTDMFYIVTHDKECLLDLKNGLYYKVKNQRFVSIGIKLSDTDFESIGDTLDCPSTRSIRQVFDVLTNYA